MKLTIVAATGGIGRHLLDQALDGGHVVTAVVRNPSKLHRHVESAAVDLTAPDREALQRAVGHVAPAAGEQARVLRAEVAVADELHAGGAVAWAAASSAACTMCW